MPSATACPRRSDGRSRLFDRDIHDAAGTPPTHTADDQVDDRPHDQGSANVVDVLEVVAPARPVVADLAAEHPKAGYPQDGSEPGECDEALEGHLRRSGGVRHSEPHDRDEPGGEDRPVAVALEP